jgi:hypothetical protein
MKTGFWSIKRVAAIAAVVCGALSASAASAQEAGSQGSRYTTYTTPSLTVRVHWSTQQEVEQRCGKGAAGCASPATMDKAYAEIWAQKPTGWEDLDAICYLGGVVLRVVDAGTPRTNTAAAQIESAVPQLQTVLR